jgi:antitoxin VapB
MAFHVRDPKTDALVRELAASRGIGVTEAIREATQEALERDGKKLSLWERTADIRARLNANPDPDFKADKAFYDWLSDEDDR